MDLAFPIYLLHRDKHVSSVVPLNVSTMSATLSIAPKYRGSHRCFYRSRTGIFRTIGRRSPSRTSICPSALSGRFHGQCIAAGCPSHGIVVDFLSRGIIETRWLRQKPPPSSEQSPSRNCLWALISGRIVVSTQSVAGPGGKFHIQCLINYYQLLSLN